MVETDLPYPGSPEGPTKHFWFFLTRLEQRRPFSFIRFSDGELEILKNEKLEISDNKIVWSKGQVNFSYPEYDFKSFLPEENAEVRVLLEKSAIYSADNFFKGIPTAHNRAPADTALMKKLSSSEVNLTFADLFMNENYPLFLREFVPRVKARDNVSLIGNYRMNSAQLNPNWLFFGIPDNAFDKFLQVVGEAHRFCLELPRDYVVLCSASSITNVLGHQLHEARPDLTFVDIGTTLHPLTGMPPSRRSYLTQMEPWAPSTFVPKLKYLLSPGRRLRW